MTLPYLPGWWDEINRGGQATNFVKALDQRVRPDAYANQRLQEMVQQNPLLMEQFSNMDDGTRNMLAQSLGFKNQNPIAQLPVGQQRKDREAQAAYKQTLDPRQTDIMMAGQVGTKDKVSIAREDEQYDMTKKIQGLNFEKLSSDVPLGKLLNAEKERALTKLNEMRARAGGKFDPAKIANAMLNGNPSPEEAEMFAVIQNEPGMGEAMNTLIEMGKLAKQNKYSMGLRFAGMQDDFTRLAISSVSQAAGEYNKAAQIVNKVVGDAALAKISIEEALKADPARKQMYDDALVVRDEAQQRLNMYKPLVQSGFERMGVKFPDVAPAAATPTQEVIPANETPEQRLARLKRKAGIP